MCNTGRNSLTVKIQTRVGSKTTLESALNVSNLLKKKLDAHSLSVSASVSFAMNAGEYGTLLTRNLRENVPND